MKGLDPKAASAFMKGLMLLSWGWTRRDALLSPFMLSLRNVMLSAIRCCSRKRPSSYPVIVCPFLCLREGSPIVQAGINLAK